MENTLKLEKSLNQHLRAKGIKQIHLAKLMDISESYVSLILRGKRRMNIEQAKMISTISELSLDQVYSALMLNIKNESDFL